MRKKKSKNKEDQQGGKKRVDRFVLFLLTCTTLTFALWALLASLIAYHFRTKSEMAYVNLQDSRAAMADVKSSSDTRRQSSHDELIHAEILRSEVGQMFRQLLLAEEQPKSFGEFVTTLQAIFGEISGETMSRMDMITLKKTLTELLGVVPKSARPPPRIIKQRIDVKKASAAMVAEKIISVEERAVVEQALTRFMNGQSPKGMERAKKPPAVSPPAPVKKVAVVPAQAKAVVAPPKAVVATKPAPAKPTRKEFVDKTNGYRVSFPLDWNMREDADSATVLARSPRKDFSQLYTAYVIITAQRSKEALVLQPFSAKAMHRVEQSMGAYEELSTSAQQLSGVESKQLRLRFERLGRTFESTYVFCVRGKVGYMISFTVPEDQVEQSKVYLKDILKQFKFL